MNVALIHPPGLPDTTLNREGAAGFGTSTHGAGGFIYPPHTLAACAAVLKTAGHTPAIIDASGEGMTPREALDHTAVISPGALVILVSAAAWEADLAFCRALRARFSWAPIIAIGPILRDAARAEAMAAVCDMVLVGEPERALPAAVGGAKRVETGPAPILAAAALAPEDYTSDGYLRDIAGLPAPAWEQVSLGQYRFISVLSSRGCDQKCRYCPYVVGWGHTFRACPPPRVADELEGLVRRFSPTRVVFRDPVFAHDRARVVGMCEDILRRRLAIRWECESRPEHFDAELLGMMRQAGCARIKIGLESADAGRLVSLQRVPDEGSALAYLDKTREVVAACRQLGIRSHVFAMVGLPDMSEVELGRLADFLAGLGADDVSIKPLEIYPLTPMAQAGVQVDASAGAVQAARIKEAIPPPSLSKRDIWRRAKELMRRNAR